MLKQQGANVMRARSGLYIWQGNFEFPPVRAPGLATNYVPGPRGWWINQLLAVAISCTCTCTCTATAAEAAFIA